MSELKDELRALLLPIVERWEDRAEQHNKDAARTQTRVVRHAAFSAAGTLEQCAQELREVLREVIANG